jgi:hypothetical protein
VINNCWQGLAWHTAGDAAADTAAAAAGGVVKDRRQADNLHNRKSAAMAAVRHGIAAAVQRTPLVAPTSYTAAALLQQTRNATFNVWRP